MSCGGIDWSSMPELSTRCMPLHTDQRCDTVQRSTATQPGSVCRCQPRCPLHHQHTHAAQRTFSTKEASSARESPACSTVIPTHACQAWKQGGAGQPCPNAQLTRLHPADSRQSPQHISAQAGVQWLCCAGHAAVPHPGAHLQVGHAVLLGHARLGQGGAVEGQEHKAAQRQGAHGAACGSGGAGAGRVQSEPTERSAAGAATAREPNDRTPLRCIQICCTRASRQASLELKRTHRPPPGSRQPAPWSRCGCGPRGPPPAAAAPADITDMVGMMFGVAIASRPQCCTVCKASGCCRLCSAADTAAAPCPCRRLLIYCASGRWAPLASAGALRPGP